MITTTPSQPYIDPPPTESELSAAQALITHDLPTNHTQTLHPSLAPLSVFPTSSSILSTEISRPAINAPPPRITTAIDLTRYEALDELDPGSDGAAVYRDALRGGFANTTYLGLRAGELGLLEEYGRNAWLVGNAVVEDLVRRVEGEVQGLRERVEEVNRERKTVQEMQRGEVEALEETWRNGVSRIIETQVATAKLRDELHRARTARSRETATQEENMPSVV